jgi:predicted MFS family arabinose efflux permease
MNVNILLLALGTFAIGTETFMIAGLLPAIAEYFAVSLSAAGQLVTVFSFVYAVGSPVLMTMAGRAERRGCSHCHWLFLPRGMPFAVRRSRSR